jgi:hypothetical protein
VRTGKCAASIWTPRVWYHPQQNFVTYYLHLNGIYRVWLTLKEIVMNGYIRQFILFLALFVVTGCSKNLRIQSDFVPNDSLRLAQVTAVGKRADIVQAKPLYNAILAAGIPDTEVVDGSVVMARTYCCGGMTDDLGPEKVSSVAVFVPKEVTVAQGDIVEVRVGRPPKNGDAGKVHLVTRVVQKYGGNEERCWWDPKDNRLWLRVLYCDWMPNEGWIKQGGTKPAWYKPAPSAVVRTSGS